MKKYILLTLMGTLFSLSVNAQIWVGGELGLKLDKTTLGDFEMDKQNSFEFAPEIGLNINSKWAVAVRLKYTHQDNGETKLIDKTIIGNSNSFSVEPFVRYTFCQKGQFSFFLDGGIWYSHLSKSNYDDALHTFGLGVCPGLRFAITDKVGLTGHLGNIGYEHSWMDDRGTELKNDTFSLNIFSTVSFGAYLCF